MAGDFLVEFRDWVTLWLPVFFVVLLILMVVLMWRMLKLMPQVKPAQIQANSKSAVTFADVAGNEAARAELQEVVDFLRAPKRFEQLGARVPKGMLLHGPPGTGKTLLAKAVAHESGARFYAASASSFVEMAASNRIGDLDPALLRPGRFDRQVLVGPPDLAGRQEILRVHTRGKPLAADVDVGLIARQTAGLTGADL